MRPWTRAELSALNEMRVRGLEWAEIAAALPGRTPAACQCATVRHKLPCREPAKRRVADDRIDAAARLFEAEPHLTDRLAAARLGMTENEVLWIRYRHLKLAGMWDRMRGVVDD